MPSLQPGTPGAKEAYGISIIQDDLWFAIPLKAMVRYGIQGEDIVLLVTGHRGEGGFGLIKKDTAIKSVFARFVDKIEGVERVYRFDGKAYALARVDNGIVQLTSEMLQSFYLEPGSRLLVVKSTTVAVSFTPVDIWKQKLAKHGLLEAIENISKLEEY